MPPLRVGPAPRRSPSACAETLVGNRPARRSSRTAPAFPVAAGPPAAPDLFLTTFRSMPTATAEDYNASKGSIGKASTRRLFERLQIGEGPRRSPSACSEILKKDGMLRDAQNADRRVAGPPAAPTRRTARCAARPLPRAPPAAVRVTRRSAFFFEYPGACRRRTPRSFTDLKALKEASRQGLNSDPLQPLGGRRRHAPKRRQK